MDQNPFFNTKIQSRHADAKITKGIETIILCVLCIYRGFYSLYFKGRLAFSLSIEIFQISSF